MCQLKWWFKFQKCKFLHFYNFISYKNKLLNVLLFFIMFLHVLYGNIWHCQKNILLEPIWGVSKYEDFCSETSIMAETLWPMCICSFVHCSVNPFLREKNHQIVSGRWKYLNYKCHALWLIKLKKGKLGVILKVF